MRACWTVKVPGQRQLRECKDDWTASAAGCADPFYQYPSRSEVNSESLKLPKVDWPSMRESARHAGIYAEEIDVLRCFVRGLVIVVAIKTANGSAILGGRINSHREEVHSV